MLCVFTIAYAFSRENQVGQTNDGSGNSVQVSDEISENGDVEFNTTDEDYDTTQDKSFEEALKNGKISNVLISDVADKNVTLFYCGEERKFAISNADELKEYVGQICDIESDEGVVTKVTFNSTVSNDYLLSLEDGYMIFENGGKIPVSEDCVIIRKNDQSKNAYTSISSATLNNERLKVSLFTKDNKVSGIIYTGPNLETISVLIKNNDYTNIKHSKVSVSSKNGIIVKTYNNSTKVKITKDVNNITVNSKDEFSRMVITGANNSLLSINSIKRCEKVTYYGSITIINTKDGLVIVNTLPLEKYLYGVLTSEMPASFGEEAYKAQAICARTYALDKMTDYKYKEYGAALDDSTTFQVYNKNPRTKEAISAVDATKGLVLVYKEKLASTCYFSTSCGYTASVDEVFGGNNPGNMVGKMQTVNNAVTEDDIDKDMSGDKAFVKFIDDGFDYKDEKAEEYIEENCNWYRWKTYIEYDRLEETHKGSKWDAGNISQIKVKVREKSGVVSSLEIQGEKEVVIEGQSSIRKYLAPVSEKLVCKGERNIEANTINDANAIRDNMKLLPSGFFYVKQENEGIHIVGGGYGHGAGMSQYGAMWLSKAGFGYEDILEHYFEGCIIVDSVTSLINP